MKNLIAATLLAAIVAAPAFAAEQSKPSFTKGSKSYQMRATASDAVASQDEPVQNPADLEPAAGGAIKADIEKSTTQELQERMQLPRKN